MALPGTLTEFNKLDVVNDKVANPLASFGGAEPEDLAETRLTGPRTLNQQNRAVTPQDYADALLRGVPWGASIVQPSLREAQSVWTGSRNTVVVSVDFADRHSLADVPIVGTFGAMYVLGFSLNNLTLMALTISTGSWWTTPS